MPGGTGPGGVPKGNPSAGGGLSGPDRWIPSFQQALNLVAGPQASQGSNYIPPISASINGQMRDYLMKALGLLRFGANIEAASFEFTPSIGIVARDLEKLRIGLNDFRVPLEKAIKLVMIPSIRENFDVGGRPPWEPLDMKTTVGKHRKTAKPILVRTGKLKSAATSFQIWSITAGAATIKSLPNNVWYGYVHQEGLKGQGNVEGGWFMRYQAQARGILNAGGGRRARQKDIDRLAWQIFDTESASNLRRNEPNIPQRRFVMFQAEDVSKIQEIFYDWIDEQIVKLGKFVPGF